METNEIREKSAEWMTMDEITAVPQPVKKILLATDGSVSAIKATKFSIGLARKVNAEILAVYVSGNEDGFEIPNELKGKKF